MLALERKNGEKILLRVAGLEIVVQLVRSSNKRAKIGIEAPREVFIIRSEIADLQRKAS